MPKNLFQDMVKVKRMRQEEARKAQNPETERVSNNNVVAPQIKKEARETRQEFHGESQGKKSKKGGRKSLWFVALASVGFFLFALSFLFAKAEVAVNPRVEDLVLNENLSAVKDPSGEELSFDLVSISDEEIKTVQSTSQKEISQQAEGTVVIYNNYSAASQLLSIDTRLEGSNGKIYKTRSRVTVPGKTKDGKPGSVEAKIYASVAGIEYNSVPLDFTIFGFKGTAKYSKFYARSKGSITGGLKGKFFTIPDTEKITLTNELKASLKEKLFKKATDQIPSGFILPKNAIVLLTEDDAVSSSSSDSNLEIKLTGTLYGVLFNESKLTQKIASNNVSKYDGSAVYIQNINELNFSFSSQINVSNLADLKNITFNLSGPAKIIWKVDAPKLVSELIGKSKKNFNQILSQYPNIESASLALSPFWKMSFPDENEDINVIINYPQ